MSIYDILMLIVFGGAVLFGMWKGLSWQIASLAAVFVSYFVAITFRGQLASYISATEPWNQFAAMAILYLGTSLVIWMAYGYVRRSIDNYKLNGFDRQAGAILGAIKGAILCLLVTLFSVSLFGETVRKGVIESKSGGYIAAAINRLDAVIPTEIHSYLDEHLKKFNDQLNKEQPGFVQEGEAKLQEKVQKFKIVTGKWNSPSTPPTDANQFGGMRTSTGPPSRDQFGNRQVNYDANRTVQEGQSRTQFQQFTDDLKKDARNFLDEQGNAISSELRTKVDQGISTGADDLKKKYDDLFAPKKGQ